MTVEPPDRRARFETLFRRHRGAVRAYALRRTTPTAAEDAVAETFLIAWRRLDEIGDDPLPWLYGVARRVLANEFRGERRRGALHERLLGERDPGTAPPLDAVSGLGETLADALATLSTREREALLLVAWEDLTPERAARAAGCTTAAFRVRLHRARRHLTARLDPPTLASRPGGTPLTAPPLEKP